MKQETLKKAKDLENAINEYGDLLLSRNADYHTMLINITCAYSNNHTDYHGRVSKEVWEKMLDVVAEERQKTSRELEALTDDSADGVTINTAPKNDTDAVDPLDSWMDKFKRSMERPMSGLLYFIIFCFLLRVAGPELSMREVIAYSLILGLITGSISNIEWVIRELFGKKEG